MLLSDTDSLARSREGALVIDSLGDAGQRGQPTGIEGDTECLPHPDDVARDTTNERDSTRQEQDNPHTDRIEDDSTFVS